MKKLFHIASFAGLLAVLLVACKKDETRAVLDESVQTTPVITASASTLVLDSAGAATKTGLTTNWTPAKYNIDLAFNYTLQIDSAGRNFSRAVNVNLGANLGDTMTVAALNSLLIDTTIGSGVGLLPAVAGKVEMRIKADAKQTANAATPVSSLYSNVISLTVTPYTSKPSAKYPVPASLYIVGSATPGQWDNPVPVPSQQFTRLDDFTYGIILPLTGGQQFVFLPVNGSWDHKYNVVGSGTNATPAGQFLPDAGGDNINGPAASGTYKIIVDFLHGTYTVDLVDPATIPTNLFMVGAATPGGWDNPVPVPSQQFIQAGTGIFQLTLALTGGQEWLMLPVNGSWDHKYALSGTAADNKLSGPFMYDAATNFPGPLVTGTYKITANFINNQYTLTKQ